VIGVRSFKDGSIQWAAFETAINKMVIRRVETASHAVGVAEAQQAAAEMG